MKANKEAAAFSVFHPAYLIKASAGTGKTYQLTNRLISLLVFGESPEKIVATTFTRKAAGEILSRLFTKLAIASEDRAKAQEIAASIGQQSFSSDNALGLLENLIQNQHRLQICTLDSFFIQIAKSFSLEIGLPVEWTISEKSKETEINNEALSQTIAKESPLMLASWVQLANKGTRSHKVYNDLAQNLLSLHAIFRDSTISAWNWIDAEDAPSKSKVIELIERLKSFPTFLTNEGNERKKFKDSIEYIISCATNNEWENLFKKGIPKAIIENKACFDKVTLPLDLIAIVKDFFNIARIKFNNTQRHSLLAHYKLLELYDLQLEALKTAFTSFSFYDIAFYLSKSLSLDSLSEIYYRLDSQIHHLLLDEFQDTSVIQWKVVQPIIEEILSKATVESSFFCVGDIKQAIYEWRGGEAELLNSVERRYPILHSQQLDISYRSAPEIIEVVNKTFQSLKTNTVLAKWTEARDYWAELFPEHRTTRNDLRGFVEIYNCSEDLNSESYFKTVARYVKEIANQAPEASIAVLARKNETLTNLINYLKSKDINLAVSEEGGGELKRFSSVQLIISLLKFLDNPLDKISRYHFSESQLAELLGFKANLSDPQAFEFARAMRKVIVSQGYGQTISSWSNLLLPMLNSSELSGHKKLVEAAYRYDSTPSLNPSDFIEYANQCSIENLQKTQVRVMTIHKSKGLEFDVVFLIGLEQSLIASPKTLTQRNNIFQPLNKVCPSPNSKLCLLDERFNSMYSQHQNKQVKEALNVLYVAMTRASRAMFIMLDKSKTKNKTSFSEIIQNALDIKKQSINNKVLFSLGDKDWTKLLNQTKITKKISPLKSKAPTAPLLIQFPSIKMKGFRQVSPSALEGSSSDKPKTNLRLSNHEALRYGSIVHALFEKVSWLEEINFDEESLIKTLNKKFPESVIRREHLQHFFNALNAPVVSKLFSRQKYSSLDANELKVFTELPFAIIENETLIQGSIDRLVIAYKNQQPIYAEVIDLKTDKLSSQISGQSIQEKAIYYKPQLDSYRKVVTKITKLKEENVRTKLVFTSSAEVWEYVPNN